MSGLGTSPQDSPEHGAKPLWAVALDKMRTEDGGERFWVVQLNADEAFAFVQHYLATSDRSHDLELALARLYDATQSENFTRPARASEMSTALRAALKLARQVLDA